MQRLLGDKLYPVVYKNAKERISEIRLRLGRNVFVSRGYDFCKVDCIVTQGDIDRILCIATDNSVYALSERINNGYINYKNGIRIGIAGEAVMDKNKVHSIKNITSLAIRIPFEAKGCSDFLPLAKIMDKNILIISPPFGGKTTMLRDITRRIANACKNVVVIDERFELSGAGGQLDLGECSDVIKGMSKNIAYINAVRALNPYYIITDELMGEEEINSINDIKRCGIKVVATIHSNSLDALINNRESKRLTSIFDAFVVLSAYPKAGTVVEVVYA